MLIAAALLAATLTSQSEAARLTTAALLKEGFTKEEAAALLKDERLKPYPVPSRKTTIDWQKYTSDLLAPGSVARGRKFAEEHAGLLCALEKKYGVPWEHLVTIARIETDLGGYTGTHSLLRVFWGMILRYPEAEERAKAARQLAAAVAYCRSNGISDCFDLKGSYAGAIGLTQFLPLTLKEDGVDWDANGKIDVFGAADALASAANFLKQRGWSQDPKKQFRAIARYYGLDEAYWNRPYNYPKAALLYAQALKRSG